MDRHEDGKTLLTRREAILRVSAMLGGAALVGQAAMLAGCEAGGGNTETVPDGALFTNGEIALLDEIAETILPETLTPGARAAGVGPFIALMVADTYDPREQAVFRAGLEALEERCAEAYGAGFLEVSAAHREALLVSLDTEQFEAMRFHSGDAPVHYFRMLKELTLLGYFTSQAGYTEALRYVETPGRFDPCVPLRPGEKAWARHA